MNTSNWNGSKLKRIFFFNVKVDIDSAKSNETVSKHEFAWEVKT